MLSDKNARYVIDEIIALYPDVKTMLNYNNEFELLVAVLLSAQTTDVAVNKVTPDLFERFPDPESMAIAPPEEISPYIKKIGLYRNKSKYLHEMSKILVEKFDGKVPANRKDLESLPGVGRKTASVVLSVGFNIPAFAVDTHITRVSKHHQIVDQDATVRQIEQRITSLLPEDQWTQAHQSMIWFGREVCHPKNPECENYPQLYTFPYE